MTPESEKPTNEFLASAYETDIATLIPTEKHFGDVLLTAFILVEQGTDDPYKGCIVEIKEGPDTGKKYIANVGKPQRMLEPMTISLIKMLEDLDC